MCPLETAQWRASRPLSSFDLRRVGFSLNRSSIASISPSKAQSWMVRFLLSPPPSPIILFFGSETKFLVFKYSGHAFFWLYFFIFLNTLGKLMTYTGDKLQLAHCNFRTIAPTKVVQGSHKGRDNNFLGVVVQVSLLLCLHLNHLQSTLKRVWKFIKDKKIGVKNKI